MKKNLILIVDAAQGAGIVPIDMKTQEIDFLCTAGHKGLYGPMGTGLLLCNSNRELHTIEEGGTGNFSASYSQPKEYPERLESGTLNVPGILGLSEGVNFVKEQGTTCLYQKEMEWIQKIDAALKEIPNIRLYQSLSKHPDSYVPLLPFNIDNIQSEEVGQQLSNMGIAVRAGLHCAGLAHRSMHTEEQGVVRICPSAFTTEKDVNTLLNSIFKIAKSV